MVIDAVRAEDPQVLVAREGYTYEEVEALWSLPRLIVPILTKLKGQARPLPFVEDVAVPPDSLHGFLVQAQKVFQKHEVTASLYAHAAEIRVAHGAIVQAGDNLGLVGSTDSLYGSGVHFEIREGREARDPARWLERRR